MEMDGCDDLHSISLISNSPSYLFPDWDLRKIGILNSDISQIQYMGSTTPFYEHDLSTGYLQDVLFKFPSKKRRLFMFDGGGESLPAEDPSEDCCTTSVIHNHCQDLSTICRGISGLKPDEETNSETFESSSSSQKELSADNQWNNDKGNVYAIDPLPSSVNKDKRKKKVVYPFAVVKPAGFEGATTLNDINRRILMPPTRQLRHPVGDFACRPLVLPKGPGLSGKSVVSLTRIQTQGRGTITIIRTMD